jgi:hypothetical protein
MPKTSNKAFKELTSLIDAVINLDNVEEFESAYRQAKLFTLPPDWWDETEKQICDYQGRIINELEAGIKKIFGRDEKCQK